MKDNNLKIKHLKYFGILIAIISVVSCKTLEDPNVIIENPVFKAIGTVNGAPLELLAGEDAYFMETGYQYDESDAVYDFFGSFKKVDCDNCGPALHFKIRNFRQSAPGELIDTDSAFVRNYYTIRTDNPVAGFYSMSFNSQTFGNVATQSWSFGDGYSGNQPDENHIYTHPGVYTIGFKALYANGCADSIVNTIRLGIPEAVCRANFNLTITGNTVIVTNAAVGIAPMNYTWDFGDGYVSNDLQPEHTYSNAGIYLISLHVTDASNHVSEFARKAIILPTADCVASMLYPQLTFEPNPTQLSTVTIDYTDAAGNNYSSLNSPADENSYFKILTIQEYAENEAGDRVKKLTTRFRCRLYDSSQTSFVDLDFPEVVIGMAFR